MIIFHSGDFKAATTLVMKENKELRESVCRLEVNKRLLEERVERLETWASQTEQD